jgi:hypothetical protein|tara:strand:+ start:634 stop:1299 length:666 start_codon:yes stop_codon:yes gene_type:complete
MAISKFNYNSFNVTPVAGAALAFDADADGFSTATATSMVHIKTITASGDSTIDFIDGTSSVVLDNTYPTYLFKFINVHPATNGTSLLFQANVVGGSGFNETITSTFFRAYHGEGAEGGVLAYETGSDFAQSTSAIRLTEELIGNENDECASGSFYLFNPSSTTFVTHFMAEMNAHHGGNYNVPSFVAGYINTTAAIDEIQFKLNSGNIDSGTFKLYGIKDS